MRYKHNCLSVSLLGRRSSDIVKDLNASNDTLDRIKDRAEGLVKMPHYVPVLVVRQESVRHPHSKLYSLDPRFHVLEFFNDTSERCIQLSAQFIYLRKGVLCFIGIRFLLMKLHCEGP